MKTFLLTLLLIFSLNFSIAQYWQQAVDYTMAVSLDAETARYKGSQKLIYTNNAPETLKKVFYHQYFNAFQPGSEMAVQLRNSPDRNTRFKVNLDSLNKDQQGFLRVSNLTQDGVLLNPVNAETILEVPLNEPIPPGGSSTFKLNFIGHVPDVIRRAGKNSKEGVAVSMAHW